MLSCALKTALVSRQATSCISPSFPTRLYISASTAHSQYPLAAHTTRIIPTTSYLRSLRTAPVRLNSTSTSTEATATTSSAVKELGLPEICDKAPFIDTSLEAEKKRLAAETVRLLREDQRSLKLDETKVALGSPSSLPASASEAASPSTSSAATTDKSRKPVHHPSTSPRMHRKVRSAAGNSLRRAPKALAADEPTEEVSESIRILCDAMQEANVTMVREGPPVFLASTYQQAEQAMEIFTEYYEVTHGGIGPVGFDTETTTLFLRPQTGTSLVQIATDDVCLMFQVNRITKWNTDRSLFPSRLRAFLESPTQIMVGVGARNDAYQLKHYYGVSCAGIVGLEVMAAGKKLLARSLAELDALYGRPGREVIKSKAIVRCDWDKANMNPGWVWYAAKDAFAGLAIFNNMRAGTLKKGHKSFAELYPLAEAEEMADITGFLRRALRKQKTLGGVETLLRRDYTRFRKMYQPEERAEHAKKYIRLLLQRGRLRILDGQDVSSDLDSNHMVKLEMCPLSKILTTPEAIQALSPYFGNQTLDLSTLRDKTIMSLMSRHFERTPSETKKQLDEQDLRIFVELADSWDYPRKSGALNKYYWYLVFNTVVSREKILDTDMPAVTETDQDATRTQVESQFEPLKEDTSHSVDATLEGSTEVSMDAALEEVTKDEMDAALEDLSLNRSSKSKGTHVVQTMSAISDEDHIRAVRLWLGFIGRMRRRGVLIQTDDVVYVSPEIERALLETIPLPPPSPLLCPNTATSAVDGEEGDPSKIEQQPFA